ncbi:hypothetical protein [Chelativorans salis]|uniref:hypothetical protein n=1 Tax=Chelativorans salis TaxID=2978478 RepID=UPI003CC64127
MQESRIKVRGRSSNPTASGANRAAQEVGITLGSMPCHQWNKRKIVAVLDQRNLPLEYNRSPNLCGIAGKSLSARTGRLQVGPLAGLAATTAMARQYADDLKKLGAGILLYDTFYRWC